MLGSAYLNSGRHVAALKTLSRALELDSTNWMALYHIGDIHTQLGAYNDAIEAYEKVVEMTKDTEEVGVKAAMAETMLALGRQSAAGGFRERARRAFHAALKLASGVLESGKHRPWAWKIVGDATFDLDAQQANMTDAESTWPIVQILLQQLVTDDSSRRSQVSGLGHASNLLQTPLDLSSMLKSSIFAFAYRVHLLANEPRVADSALYDLATACHGLAQRGGDEAGAARKAAVAALRLALERGAGDERLWNALGVVAETEGPQVAQHAFVVALELYAKVGFPVLRARHCD
jgi:superkiller protein 3